jgi:outer membrane protein TolC
VTLAHRNYETQQREYRLGLINNLEVLQVLANLQDVERQWLISKAAARLNSVRLKIAMGVGL